MISERHQDAADAREIAEAVVKMLTEAGLVSHGALGGPARILNVREVAQLLRRSPPWVYDHATELGAIRMGNGPRARIGFSLASIEDWKRDHQAQPLQPRAAARRRPGRHKTVGGAELIPYEPAG